MTTEEWDQLAQALGDSPGVLSVDIAPPRAAGVRPLDDLARELRE